MRHGIRRKGEKGPDSGKHSILKYQLRSSLNTIVIPNESKGELKQTNKKNKKNIQFYKQWMNLNEKTCFMINNTL